MLINQHGSVIPHVSPGTPSQASVVHSRANYAFNCKAAGAIHKLDTILVDCWAKGFSMYETINICSVNGYALCIAETARRRVWATWDAGWSAHCKEFEDLCESDKQVIQLNALL